MSRMRLQQSRTIADQLLAYNNITMWWMDSIFIRDVIMLNFTKVFDVVYFSILMNKLFLWIN